VQLVNSTSSVVTPALITSQPWFEFLLSGGYQLTVLIWLCVLSLLSLVLAAFLFHFCRRHRYLVARGEVVGLATRSTPASPSSVDQQQYQLTSAGDPLFSFHVT